MSCSNRAAGPRGAARPWRPQTSSQRLLGDWERIGRTHVFAWLDISYIYIFIIFYMYIHVCSMCISMHNIYIYTFIWMYATYTYICIYTSIHWLDNLHCTSCTVWTSHVFIYILFLYVHAIYVYIYIHTYIYISTIYTYVICSNPPEDLGLIWTTTTGSNTIM